MMISAAHFRGIACMTLLALSSITGQASNAPPVELVVGTAADPTPAGNDGIFRNSYDYFPIQILPEDWANAWIGARKQFVASGPGYDGQPPELVWSSSDDSVVRIDAGGFATALESTLEASVTATSGPYSHSINVSVAFDGSSGPGVMYTVYFARSDTAPALLVDGRLQTPELYADMPWADPIAPWPAGRPTIAKFEWEGDYIGLLTDVANGAGTLRAKGRVEEWAVLGLANVRDFDLVRNLEYNSNDELHTALYVAVLREDNALLVKKGIHGAWSTLATAVAEFKVEPNPFQDASIGLVRFGALNLDGSFHVKDGVTGAWTLLGAAGIGIREFQFANNRIAVLFDTGRLRIKEGIQGPWTTLLPEGTGVDSFELENDRIGVLLTDGEFRVKDTINGAWSTLVAAAAGARSFQLEGDRIGVLLNDGSFRAKDGIQGAWHNLAAGGIDSFQLQRNHIGVLRGNDFLVKTGLAGTWSEVWHPNGEVTQYRLAVDVPTPAARTTIAGYNAQQELCRIEGPTGCYQFLQPVFPPPAWYGRFCGGGHPGNWAGAWPLGAIDAFDATCIHHDLAGSWYPEIDGFAAQTCIVRYALRYSRLTLNGSLLTHGGDDAAGWNQGWSSDMPNLKAATDTYFNYLGGTCFNVLLDNFIEDTASNY